MKKLFLAASLTLALVVVPASLAGAPAGLWGGTADIDKNAQVTSVVADSGEYAVMWVPALSGKTFSQISALGFDSLAGSRLGAGAPRFSLLFDDGSYLFPSALYCQQTLADGTVRSDFMAASDCLVYGFTPSTGFVAKSWADWAEVFGSARIEWAGLLIDEAGSYSLANIEARP